jgi:hypothetical protein
LLVIYAIDAKGKKLKKFAPIIDGTFERLEESEEFFSRLRSYLKALAVDKAQEVIFIGDGAPWVSNRVPKLVKELKIGEDKVRVVVDFYHAVEHLKAAADEHKQWTETQRKAWIKKQRSRLYTLGGTKIPIIHGLEGKAVRATSQSNALGAVCHVIEAGRQPAEENREAATGRARCTHLASFKCHLVAC